jgi:Undecaprenyl-phosphate glucose phosphotransferase
MAAFTAEDMKRVGPDEAAGRQGPANRSQKLTALAEALAEQSSSPAYSPIVVTGLVRLLDFIIIMVTGLIVQHLYLPAVERDNIYYLITAPAIAAAAVIMFQALRINNIPAFRAPLHQGLRMAAGFSAVMIAAIAAVSLLRIDASFSRVWLASWLVAGLGGVLLERVLVSILVRHLTRSGRLERRTVIVGGGPAGEQLLQEFSKSPESDLRIYGVFDDRNEERSPDVVAGFPKLGTIDDLVNFARHARVDLVIFTLPISAEQRLLEMLRKLWVLPLDIRLAAHTNKLRFRPRSYSYIGNIPVLDVFDKPIADWDVVMKAAFDRIVGALCLLFLSPLLLLVPLAVKLDSKGPILFRQKRYGFNNELIEVYKFRSMYVDQQDFGGRKLATRGDPRITRVGRFIRRTSLDELPQLLNVVFKGNLSLVGPRPHAIHAMAADREYDEVVDGYFARHRVRPGITGWAQVNGWRGETDTAEKLQRRIEHDLHYIENWSIFFDIYILLITPFAVLKGENAY